MHAKLIFASALLLTASVGTAHAISDIKSPYVEKGEMAIEYKPEWTHDNDSKSKKNKQEHVLEVNYGFTDWLKTGTELEFVREAGNGGVELEKLEFEAITPLTEKGAYWWDLGLMGYYKHAVKSGAADQVELLLLAQNRTADFTTRVNIELEHSFGEQGNNVDLEARAFSRYEYAKWFKPGIEWQADFKEVDDIPATDQQQHYLGPVAFGHITALEDLTIDESDEFEYEFAYLFGLTEAAADGAVRAKLEYKFKF